MGSDPLNGLIRNSGGEVLSILCCDGKFDRRRIAIERGFPLAHRTGHKAIKIFKTQPGRPTIEWTYWRNFPIRSVMPFAESGCAVTVTTQYFGNGNNVFSP